MSVGLSICAAMLAAFSGAAAVCQERPPAMLTEIHRTVMAEAVYVSDPPGQDVWRASTVGDCEDLALEMRQRLVTAGIPGADMTIVVTWNPRLRAWHAALLVRLGGAWILDSLQPAPHAWDGKGIEWAIEPHGRRLAAIDGRRPARLAEPLTGSGATPQRSAR